jgi:hypothetical protein
MIDELNRIAQKARAERLSTEDVLAEIADISPDLAKKLKAIGPWPVVGILIFLFWLVKSVSLDLKIDVNWLIDEAWHVAHGDDPKQHIGTQPPEFDPAPQKRVPNRAPNRSARRRATAQAKREDRRTR